MLRKSDRRVRCLCLINEARFVCTVTTDIDAGDEIVASSAERRTEQLESVSHEMNDLSATIEEMTSSAPPTRSLTLSDTAAITPICRCHHRGTTCSATKTARTPMSSTPSPTTCRDRQLRNWMATRLPTSTALLLSGDDRQVNESLPDDRPLPPVVRRLGHRVHGDGRRPR